MNSHDDMIKVIVDDSDYVAYFKDDELIIDGEERRYSLPILESFIEFLELDLVEYDEDFVLPEHPYFEIFKPKFIEENEETRLLYIDHISFLQIKFLGLFHFCFDQGFYYDELSELSAEERLHIYTKSTGNTDIPQYITQLKLLDGDVSQSFVQKKKATSLEMAFGIPSGYVEHIKNNGAKMITQYHLKSIFDVVSLVFYELLEQNIKVKKCKNCGLYFTVKTKHNSDYCDRVPDGRTQSCQKLAALATFKEKNQNNRAYLVFTKYYKRYYERSKVGTIKQDVFDKWNRNATVMRDECSDGKCDIEVFEQWCFDSFPNRDKKSKFNIGETVTFEFEDKAKTGVVQKVYRNTNLIYPDYYAYDVYVEIEHALYTEVLEGMMNFMEVENET